jgi:hypothetical protein
MEEVVRVAHFTQKNVFDFLKKLGYKATVAAIQASSPVAPPPPLEKSLTPEILTPVEVSGFFMVTGPQQVTFYATTTWTSNVGAGWTALNVTGLIGQLLTTGATNLKGSAAVSSLVSEPYNWSFTLQSDTDQVINEVRYANSVSLYPPGTVPIVSENVKYPIQGYYKVEESVARFFFTGPVPQNFTDGWSVTNLTPLKGTFMVKDYAAGIYVGVDKFGNPLPTVTYFVASSDTPVENNATPTYVTAITSPPVYSNTLPRIGTFTATEPTQGTIKINPNIVTGLFTKFRDLNTDIMFPDEPRDLNEIKNQGFSSGALLALFAKGPQDEFFITSDSKSSQWNPTFKQHTNSVMFYRATTFPGPSPTYQGQVVQVPLYPNQLGDLISNMWLRVNIPSDVTLAPNIGRSIIKQVDFLVNETIVETIYDDWYIIRDQMFLDADEQYSMNAAMQGINGEIVIPLEFFFCRRHSTNNTGRERLRKPYFPTCAMKNQNIYIRFTFQPYQWWTSNTIVHPDISNPVIITEEILLENSERMYYRNTPLRYIVNTIKKDATLTFTSGQPIFNLTAAFPVQTLAWFFRNKNYENTYNQNYYDSRYLYGYTTQYIHTSIPLNFPSGNSNFVDVITSAKITLNNMDITSVLPGGLYFGFKQPMDHSLSIPSKNIYSYSFGLTPKEYNQGGYLNFSKLNSQTTTLTLTFNPSYLAQVVQGYNLYVFYYGYNFLQFQGGFAGLPFSS